MKNYLVINGQKMELTKEQMKKLGIQEEKDNPFERKIGEKFYYINACGIPQSEIDIDQFWEEHVHRIGNYCHDEALIRQRALHETLDRLLWRFACENGELENPWDNEHYHYSIYYDIYEKKFAMQVWAVCKYLGPCFQSDKIAQRAIDEIVIPFIEKNPDFVW